MFSKSISLFLFYMKEVKSLSPVQLFVTPWTVVYQAPLSMGFSRQEYWSGLPCSPSEDFPSLGAEPQSLMSPALAGRFFTPSATWEAPLHPQQSAKLFVYTLSIR